MGKLFTPEELEELRLADEALDKEESAPKRDRSAYQKAYYQANREKRIESSMRWRRENIEHVRQKSKEYREANKEAIRERARAYYQANKERIKAKSLAYHYEHRDELLAAMREYNKRRKNPRR